MKKLCSILFLLSFCCIFLTAQVTDVQPIYKEVKLASNSPNFLADLTALGLPVDHFHKKESNHIEVILNEEELLVLEANGIPYEVLIPDMKAHFLNSLNEQPIEGNLGCGLDNFDTGDMGGYHTYDNMITHISKMKELYGGIVELIELGTSHENRMIWGVKISDNPTVDESATEGVAHFDALHHSREPMSLEAILYYMWWLLENYDNDPEAAYLIDNREMYFIPVVNPDGYVYNQQTDPNGGGLWRKNRKQVGNCFGIDLNRNYSFGWGLDSGSSNDPCTNTYRGEAPFSEPESQAVRDLIMETNPAIAFSMHTFGDVFLSPFGYADILASYDVYAEFVSEFIPKTYRGYGTTAKMLGYTSSGTTRDYLHSEGTFTWTPEIGHSFWENPSVICNRVQEFLIPMKYVSWVSGNYTCFHDFKLNNTEAIWEGETVSLNVRLKNRGLSKAAENVEVTLNSQHAALVPVTNTINYGTIAERSFQENTGNPFLFEVQGELTLGEQIEIEVIVHQDGSESYRDVIYLTAGQANVLFFDDAESGTDDWLSAGAQDWDTTFMDSYSGSHAFADSRLGNYLPSSESFLFNSNPIDLTGSVHPWLEFNTKWSLENSIDFVYLQVSINNGASWFFLKEYNQNSHWIQERIDLSTFAGQSDLLFRFVLSSDDFLHSDGFYFDDFKIVDYSEPNMVPTRDLEEPVFQALAFPNPGHSPLNLAITTDQSGMAQLTLTDLLGREVLEQKEQLLSGLNLLSLPEVAAGTYVLTIEAFNHQETIKVIRN